MLYVHLNNQGDIGYLSLCPFKLEDENATILELEQEYPPQVEGKFIQFKWNKETQKVDFSYVDNHSTKNEVENEEVIPTPEEIQIQILLTSEYNSILLESLLG